MWVKQTQTNHRLAIMFVFVRDAVLIFYVICIECSSAENNPMSSTEPHRSRGPRRESRDKQTGRNDGVRNTSNSDVIDRWWCDIRRPAGKYDRPTAIPVEKLGVLIKQMQKAFSDEAKRYKTVRE